LVVIVGPTAVGKTEISIRLAERLNGEIISADSRLFYRGMDIGTAKPTLEERHRVPHHLIDMVDPRETWSLSVFQKAAKETIAGIHARGKLPFLVGGTGQYIHAVIYGWEPPTAIPDPRLRFVLESLANTQGNSWLHDKLAILDHAAAASIDPHNLRRTIRALEVIFLTGRKFSEQRGKAASLYHLLKIGLIRPRPELFARVDARIEAMFASGLLLEVKRLLDSGCSLDMPALSAIGYRECVSVLQGGLTVEEAKIRMRRLTRLFVRRQANWFKPDDRDIHWYQAGEVTTSDLTALIRATFSINKAKI
jgi:tRNA dimethylallyltransferase